MDQGVHNFSKCIEILLTIAPRKILEVGTNIGFWAEIVYKHWKLTTQFSKNTQNELMIEGIDISNSHCQNPIFTKIFSGLPELFLAGCGNQNWEVIILENTAHELDHTAFDQLVRWSFDHSHYVLVIDSFQAVSNEINNPSQPLHSAEWKSKILSIDKEWIILSSIKDDRIGFLLLSRQDPYRCSPLLSDGQFGNLNKEHEKYFSVADLAFYNALSIRNDELVSEIESIRNSRSYRFINRLKKLPFSSYYPVILNIINRQKQKRNINQKLQAETPPDDSRIQTEADIKQSHTSNTFINNQYQWSKAENQWIDDQLTNSQPLSINHPEWRGILASSKQLFRNIFFSKDDLTPEVGNRIAALFYEAKINTVTIQGFPITYYHLIKALAKFKLEISVSLIWHGNFLHTKEDYSWESWKIVNQLYDEGYIQRIGFVKKGMAEIYRSNGMNAFFIMNLVDQIPDKPSPLLSMDPQIGIWAEPDWGWKKLPYSMLASLRLIPNAKGSVFNVSPRAEEFGRQLSVECKYYNDPLTHAQTIEKLGQMHLNLYTSLTECAPMLPLESLSVGVPCVLGPTSHYFKDDPWLYSHLVVPSPDDAYEIAVVVNRALENRDDIINRYRPYAIEYNKSAREMINTFLNL